MSEFNVHSFSAAEDGWFANSYYFDTPEGIFIIDTQLLSDYAEALLAQVKGDFKEREVTAVYITHPHPDHYIGSPLIGRKTPASFHSTKMTAAVIAKEANAELNALKERYERRLPHAFVVPKETFTGEHEISFRNLTLKFIDMGRTESPSNMVCVIPEAKAMITGDLIYNRVHPRLDDGDLDSWRLALRKLKGYKIKTVYPGHGPPAGADVFSHLIRYIDHFQIAVDYFGKGKDLLEPLDKRRIIAVICDKYPDYALPDNLLKGIDLEFARQHDKKVA